MEMHRIQRIIWLGVVAGASIGLSVPTEAQEAEAIEDSAAWVARMEEDEGGEVLVASVSAAEEGTPARLRLMCGDLIALRYDLGLEEGEKVITPGTSAAFQFKSGDKKLTYALTYEDMDGAFAGYFEPDDKLLALLRGGEDVTIVEPTHTYAEHSFTLKGSRAAIKQLLGSCK